MARLAPTKYRTADPATWTTQDIEEQQILAAIERLTGALHPTPAPPTTPAGPSQDATPTT